MKRPEDLEAYCDQLESEIQRKDEALKEIKKRCDFQIGEDPDVLNDSLFIIEVEAISKQALAEKEDER